MATKRSASDSGGAPPAKKPSLAMSPLDIGPAAGEEDLDIKVLQVQNKKLSERLRERNRHREQLEARLEKMEQDQDAHIRLQVALRQHFARLKEHVIVALTSLECEGGGAGMEEVMEEWGSVKEVGTLDNTMHVLTKCVEKLCKASQSKKTNSQSDQSSEVVGERSLALLEEMGRRYEQTAAVRAHQENLEMLESKCESLQEEVDNLRFSLEQSQTRGDRLETRLESTLTELRSRPVLHAQASEEGPSQASEEGGEGSITSGTSAAGAEGGVTAGDDKSDEVDTMQSDLAEAKELAQSRLEEIDTLSAQLVEVKKQLDKVQCQQQQLAESAVKESAVYKTLQSQFTIAALEGVQLRGCLEEAKSLLASARQLHFSQLEEIRAEEVKYQIEVREEMSVLETALATVKRDYELLRMEYERTVASNEQAGPVAKELRVMVDSLQKTISQHKSEVSRYKTRAHKAEQQLVKLQEDKEKEGKDKTVPATDKEVPETSKPPAEEPNSPKGSSEDVTKVKAQLLAVETELNSYKQAASSEEREKAELVAAEKKARTQMEELKKKFEDYYRDYEKRKEHIREEAARKSKSLSEDNRHLQKDLYAKKQEAQALVAEMESTAEAFEEMQEQNLRLLQQLKEKDDANFKLMSERIKSNSVHKLLLEEKELLHGQLNAMATERQRYLELVAQLEERDRSTETTIQGLDKELSLQQQANEAHRKKAEESVQELTKVQLQAAEQQKAMDTVQQSLSNRTEECEKESQLYKRSVEEVAGLKRKLEKYKNREWMASGDEVLLEEIKMYKAKLNCPCCSARKKDTVLTKCFHVFCSECIKNRYDSRLRKCPKCGAAFGANDFHKIYLS